MLSEKLHLRSQAKEQRNKFCASLKKDHLSDLHIGIKNRVLDFFTFKSSDIIAGYWPHATEVDPSPLLTTLLLQKHDITLPVINKESNLLLFRRWSLHTPLKEGPYKIFEPFETEPFLVPDILFIPLLNFNKFGHRLGYGKGYYDQTISSLKKIKSITTIGLAYDIQRIDCLPIEPHDEALQWIVTEKKIYHSSEVI